MGASGGCVRALSGCYARARREEARSPVMGRALLRLARQGPGGLRMKVLLVNPPYQTITSNLGVGHQVPLGLLAVGGPLLDAGHAVTLLDAEALHLSLADVAAEVRRRAPDVVMTG